MNSNTLLDLAEIYQDISESGQNFIAESEDSETPRRRRPRPTGTTSQQRARLDALRKKSANREKAIGDVIEPIQALSRHERNVEAEKEARTQELRNTSREVLAARDEAARRRKQGLPPLPKPKAPKPKVTKLQSQTETEPDAPTEHDIATGRRLGKRGTTTPETKPEDESTKATRLRDEGDKILAQLRKKNKPDEQKESYVAESRRRKKKSKKHVPLPDNVTPWWDNNRNGKGWEPGETTGHFKRGPRVAKEEYSNWREDLSEISNIIEAQKKTTQMRER